MREKRNTLKGLLFNTILSIVTHIQEEGEEEKKMRKKTILQTCDTVNQTKLYQNYYYKCCCAMLCWKFCHFPISLSLSHTFCSFANLLAKRSLECATVYVKLNFSPTKSVQKHFERYSKNVRKLFNLTETNIILSRLRIYHLYILVGTHTHI